MTIKGLPQHVKEFIGKHISSLGELEVLLLLYRDRQLELDATEVARHLCTNVPLAEEYLRKLLDEELLQADAKARYRYAPKSSLDDQAVWKIARDIHEWKVAIIDFIYSRSDE